MKSCRVSGLGNVDGKLGMKLKRKLKRSGTKRPLEKAEVDSKDVDDNDKDKEYTPRKSVCKRGQHTS